MPIPYTNVVNALTLSWTFLKVLEYTQMNNSADILLLHLVESSNVIGKCPKTEQIIWFNNTKCNLDQFIILYAFSILRIIQKNSEKPKFFATESLVNNKFLITLTWHDFFFCFPSFSSFFPFFLMFWCSFFFSSSICPSSVCNYSNLSRVWCKINQQQQI